MNYIKLSLILTFLPLSMTASESRALALVMDVLKQDPAYSPLTTDPCRRKKAKYCVHDCVKCAHHIDRARSLSYTTTPPKQQMFRRAETTEHIRQAIELTEKYRNIMNIGCEHQYPIERLFIHHHFVAPQYIYDFLVNNKIPYHEIPVFKKLWLREWQCYLTSEARRHKNLGFLEKIALEILI